MSVRAVRASALAIWSATSVTRSPVVSCWEDAEDEALTVTSDIAESERAAAIEPVFACTLPRQACLSSCLECAVDAAMGIAL